MSNTLANLDMEQLSKTAGILGEIGSFVAGIFAFAGFLILIRQIKVQQEELRIVKRESNLSILQTLVNSDNSELSKRAKYILEKNAVNFTMINEDIESIKKMGPRLCFRKKGDRFQGPITKIALNELKSLGDEYLEDMYPLKIKGVEFYNHEHDRYSRIILNEAHIGHEWKKSGFLVDNINDREDGTVDLDITVLLDSKKIINFENGEPPEVMQRYYGYLRFHDYPSGRLLGQRFQVFCYEKNDDDVRISFSLEKPLIVFPSNFNNWMLDPTEVYSIDQDGFPE